MTKELLSDANLTELGIKESDKIGSDEPEPTEANYLTFTAGAGGASVGFIVNNGGYDIPETYTKPSLQYSADGGKTWRDYDLQISEYAAGATSIELAEGASVMFKGMNENLACYHEDEGDWVFVQAYIDGNVAASGDVTSLLNGVGGDVAVPQRCYTNMFYGCTGLTSAPELPATTLADSCYADMFYDCTGLTTAPELPATTLVYNCYCSMFKGCAGLTQAPELPATTLAIYCYDQMFEGCAGLTQAPELPATTLAENCYAAMFRGCTGLTQAPELPATTLARNCYSDMFRNCTGLTAAPKLPAITLAPSCYNGMFRDCINITSYDMMTLNNSTNVFNNNSSCASLFIYANTPPTISSSTISGLKADCIIYVPDASVAAYKAAEYWSERADYIRAAGSSN